MPSFLTDNDGVDGNNGDWAIKIQKNFKFNAHVSLFFCCAAKNLIKYFPYHFIDFYIFLTFFSSKFYFSQRRGVFKKFRNKFNKFPIHFLVIREVQLNNEHILFFTHFILKFPLLLFGERRRVCD